MTLRTQSGQKRQILVTLMKVELKDPSLARSSYVSTKSSFLQNFPKMFLNCFLNDVLHFV